MRVTWLCCYCCLSWAYHYWYWYYSTWCLVAAVAEVVLVYVVVILNLAWLQPVVAVLHTPWHRHDNPWRYMLLWRMYILGCECCHVHGWICWSKMKSTIRWHSLVSKLLWCWCRCVHWCRMMVVRDYLVRRVCCKLLKSTSTNTKNNKLRTLHSRIVIFESLFATYRFKNKKHYSYDPKLVAAPACVWQPWYYSWPIQYEFHCWHYQDQIWCPLIVSWLPLRFHWHQRIQMQQAFKYKNNNSTNTFAIQL